MSKVRPNGIEAEMLSALEQVLYDADMCEDCGEPRYENTDSATKDIRTLVLRAGGNPHLYKNERSQKTLENAMNGRNENDERPRITLEVDRGIIISCRTNIPELEMLLLDHDFDPNMNIDGVEVNGSQVDVEYQPDEVAEDWREYKASQEAIECAAERAGVSPG